MTVLPITKFLNYDILCHRPFIEDFLEGRGGPPWGTAGIPLWIQNLPLKRIKIND